MNLGFCEAPRVLESYIGRKMRFLASSHLTHYSPYIPMAHSDVDGLNILIFGFAVVIVAELVRRWSISRNQLPLPPGPKRSLLTGNIFDVPRVEPWKGFRALSDKHGTFHVLLLGIHILIVHSIRTYGVLGPPTATYGGPRHSPSFDRST